ncbi:SAM-dependent methyltransferase [Luteibacter sp. W1I16]|uniref:class I SAM-dependent methyltransferase n=1 Tax=Luteibacter sp. W1I16 TaxID=3373922 RepID=UPI003D260ED4
MSLQSNDKQRELDGIRAFYDDEYYASNVDKQHKLPWHCRMAARGLTLVRGGDVLDVACGTGAWLGQFSSMGARTISGIDLSIKAIEAARVAYPDGDFRAGPAEVLPFPNASFDVVTCMGSLEHFVDKLGALREMLRVARPNAEFLLLVPNAGFLSRRLGLYGGTHQIKVKEDVMSLDEWAALFRSAGLTVRQRRRDLHPLSWRWIVHGKWPTWPFRAIQAILLGLWPVAWQYQVYHYAQRNKG